MLKLALRNLMRNWVRSSLTACSLALAMFLLCILQSVIDGTSSKIADTRSDRLFVASAVSLYVDLPLSYRSKIEQVEGVKEVTRWQWFGGYYQDPSNFFAQFAVDEEPMLSMYPEVDIVEGSREAFLGNRIGCLVGKTLCDRFGWELGERIPLIGALHPHPDGPDTPWEFEIEAIYVPEVTNFDPANLFFHWDYFEKTYELLAGGSLGVGVFAVQLEPGAERAQVIRTVEEMFENGPQRVQATTESEFQSQFVSMYGNVPRFLTFIGLSQYDVDGGQRAGARRGDPEGARLLEHAHHDDARGPGRGDLPGRRRCRPRTCQARRERLRAHDGELLPRAEDQSGGVDARRWGHPRDRRDRRLPAGMELEPALDLGRPGAEIVMVPLSYTLRSLFVRRSATLLTMSGIAAVVAVAGGVLSLQQGFQGLYDSSVTMLGEMMDEQRKKQLQRLEAVDDRFNRLKAVIF